MERGESMQDLFINSKEIEKTDVMCQFHLLTDTWISCPIHSFWTDKLPLCMHPKLINKNEYFFQIGNPLPAYPVHEKEGFVLNITADGIRIDAHDRSGLCYGLQQLSEILHGAEDMIPCMKIHDYPTLENRALMLDVSRGKVYTREYLLQLVDILASFRYNVLQLYVEHTFMFSRFPEISEGCDPLTREDILAIQKACAERCISLQANLQSLGHFRHILKLPEFRKFRESDMYWSLSTTDDRVLEFLDELYGEYLPLFDSSLVNVCLDEPYDLGADASSGSEMSKPELYLSYLNHLRTIAAKYNKQLMVFGDVFVHHPEVTKCVPDDVTLLDWCYDPKPEYGTPAVLKETGRNFWICPGTGNWNTLFPRLDGALMNIDQLLKEGLAAGTTGMMLTDWNDHGGYTQPAPGYFVYAYGALAAWQGCPIDIKIAANKADHVLNLPGYSNIILKLARIYMLPPIWSKNRSECVMALFDEPITGKTVRGALPPEGLVAYDLELPVGVEHVYERHSMHPLRPCFAIPEDTRNKIRTIIREVLPEVDSLPAGFIRDELAYILSAFDLMTDKLDLSHTILDKFSGQNLDGGQILDLEMSTEMLIKRFVRLELNYVKLWMDIAKPSEIEISMTYFAHIIERLDYLRDWLSVQREQLLKGIRPDYAFDTYEDAGYTTIPTY